MRLGNEDVICSIGIEIQGKETAVVVTEYWLNTANPDSYVNLLKLEEVFNNFGDKVEFKPQYKFQNFVDRDFTHKFQKKHCISEGRFCQVENPEIDPQSAIVEAQRQICIWNETNGSKSNDPETKSKYWKYIQYYKKCLLTYEFGTHSNLNCFEKGCDMADISLGLLEKINKCTEQEKIHKKGLIDNENNYTYSDIYLVPAFFINDEMLKEELSQKSIIISICDKLLQKPAYCDQFFVGKHEKNKLDVDDNMNGLLFIAIIGIIAILSVVLLFFRRNINKGINQEIYSEVNQYVTDYMKMQH